MKTPNKVDWYFLGQVRASQTAYHLDRNYPGTPEDEAEYIRGWRAEKLMQQQQRDFD